MHRLPRIRSSSLSSSLSLLVVLAACTPDDGRGPPDAERGRYIADSIAMCTDCHTPRNEWGELVRDRWLAGTSLPFAPSVEMPWATTAPAIAGLPAMTDEEAVTYLMTGLLPGGRRSRPPMPEFRFAARDARDVVAYLRSVGPAPGGAGR